AQTISFGGYTKLAHKTQVTGFFSYGLRSNDKPLQPFTVNAAIQPQLTLPRANTEGSAHVFATNLSLVSHPVTDWRFSGRFRSYDYNNQTPATSIPQYVSLDASISSTPTGGPDLFAHSRTTFDADATYTKLLPFALGVGYTHNGNGYDARTFKSSGEDMFRLSADAVGASWMTFRAVYEYGSRTGSGLDETTLTSIGEHPEMRQFDLADRTRNRVTAQIDIVPSDAWTFSFSTGILKDEFRTASTACRIRPGGHSRSGPTIACRTDTWWAAATTTSATKVTSGRTKGIPRMPSSTIRCATGRPTRPRWSTTSRFTRPHRPSAAKLRCGSRTTTATPKAATSTPFPWAA